MQNPRDPKGLAPLHVFQDELFELCVFVFFASCAASKNEVFAFLLLQNIVCSQGCSVNVFISRVFACGFVAKRCFRVLYRFKK